MIIIQKTSKSLWQYNRDEPNPTLTYSEPFKSKLKMSQEKLLMMIIQKMLK